MLAAFGIKQLVYTMIAALAGRGFGSFATVGFARPSFFVVAWFSLAQSVVARMFGARSRREGAAVPEDGGRPAGGPVDNFGPHRRRRRRRGVGGTGASIVG